MIKLGDKVKDAVSGYIGIAASKHIYLQGCNRITVQSEVDKEGKLPKSETFDETQLIVLEKQKVNLTNVDENPGGADKYMDEGR